METLNDVRNGHIARLLEDYARACEKHYRERGDRRNCFLKQAHEAYARGDQSLASKSLGWALDDDPGAKRLNERGEKIRSWMRDPLVWIRATNSRYSEVYHYDKLCSYVWCNYGNDFTPLLEGEALDRRMRPCSRDACKRETERRKLRSIFSPAA
ncbi:hypothetical protein [Streptomyces sp. AP-93]|uniref:hypothetical protein n=1 Tax=Streptomyces sp. AP-93 TaxID=2929048 RepID=UPI001FB0244D|nr:hypothetical protein [Streptomyces sp. AP-93]MCJ0868126.1 hypothetical protein [Streptomyces sp. AP-93]